MKILLINQSQTENYGDIAIGRIMSNFYKKNKIKVQVEPYWDENKVYGVYWNSKLFKTILSKPIFIKDFFAKKYFGNIIKISKPDFAIIGGGELISSHSGFNSALYCWSNLLSKKNIPFAITGVSGDVQMSRNRLNRYKDALKKASYISVRDRNTLKILKKHYRINNVAYRPDVVFAQEPSKKNLNRNKIIITPIAPTRKLLKYMGLNKTEEYFEYYKKQLKNINKRDIIYVLPTVKNDLAFSKELANYLKNNTSYTIETGYYTGLDEFEKELDSTKLIISARMHGMILGLIHGVKISPVPFKDKLKVFQKEYQSVISIEDIHKHSKQQLYEILSLFKQIEAN